MTFYAAFVLTCAVMVWLVVRGTSGPSRAVATVLFVALAAGTPLAYFDTLSRPKSLTDEIRSDSDVEVLAYHAEPGNALWLLLQLPGVSEPRYYVMSPWTSNTERITQQLQDGFEKEERMQIRNPFENSLETNPMTVYPLPPERLPDKVAPPAPEQHRAE